MPAPLAAVTLGGIWNAEVVPASRTDVLGWVALGFVLVLAAAGLRAWVRRLGGRDATTLGVCWAFGLAVALLTWAAPDAVAWLATHVPGGGWPATGRGCWCCARPRWPRWPGSVRRGSPTPWPTDAARALVAGGLVVLPVLLMPDAALGAEGRLRPVDFPRDYATARAVIADSAPPGDVLLLPLSSYRQPEWNGGRKVLDPAGRFQTRDFVTSDLLVVSRTSLAGEDPRVRRVAVALALATPDERAAALAQEGIGVLVVENEAVGEVPDVTGRTLLDGTDLRVVGLDDAVATPVPGGWAVAMTFAWLAFLAGPVLALVLALVPGGARSTRRRRWRHRPPGAATLRSP